MAIIDKRRLALALICVLPLAGCAQPAYGRACRQPDGSWQIVKS
jgi:hypothetical protein